VIRRDPRISAAHLRDVDSGVPRGSLGRLHRPSCGLRCVFQVRTLVHSWTTVQVAVVTRSRRVASNSREGDFPVVEQDPGLYRSVYAGIEKVELDQAATHEAVCPCRPESRLRTMVPKFDSGTPFRMP